MLDIDTVKWFKGISKGMSYNISNKKRLLGKSSWRKGEPDQGPQTYNQCKHNNRNKMEI